MEKILTLKFMLLDRRRPTETWLWTCLTSVKEMPMTPTLTSMAMLFVAKASNPGCTPSESV